MENQQRLAQGGKKRFTLQDLKPLQPLTLNQKKFVEAYNDGTGVLFQLGQAGCGKTSLSLSEAFKEVLNPKSPYEKIIIVRSAVQGRQIGHLPGELEEKAAAYELPYIDICKEIFKYNDPYMNLKAVGLVEFTLSTFLRGCNFVNAIVIVDECQNLDFEEIDTIYTRIKESSKIIFCGDGKQTDLHRYRQTSGLSQFVNIFECMHQFEDEFNDHSNKLHHYNFDTDYNYQPQKSDYAVITYEPRDCLRNPMVRKYLIAKHLMGL